MSSQPRSSGREAERRLNIRTLVIASIASAVAAVLTSQFWVQGTWMAAAITPVIVALVSEMLHRPTEVIAERVTSRGMDVLPATGGPPPSRRQERAAPRETAAPRERGASRERAPVREAAPAEPGSEGGPPAPPVRVYRSGSGKPVRPRASRRKIAVGMVAVTAVLAFAIAAIAMTGTELLTGGSIGKGGGDTTLFSGDSNRSDRGGEEQQSQPQQSSPESGQPESGGGDGGESQPQPEQPSEEPPAEEQPQQQQQQQQEPAPQAPQPQVPQQTP
jgi:hypothetical protein